MATIAYLRVSSDKQDVESQRIGITNYCKMNGMVVDRWIEIEISSRRSLGERGIDDLISVLKPYDNLVVSELSRLARSVGEIANITETILNKKVRLICIKENINLFKNGKDIDIASQIQITMIGLFAQIERSLISIRTKEGMARAKANGKIIGNPNFGKINRGRKQDAYEFAERLKPTLQTFRKFKYSQTRMVEELNRMNFKARNGGKWSLIQLQRVLIRLEM